MLLRSATMTSKVAKLQRACLVNPVKVEVDAKYRTVDTLRQQYLFVPAKHKARGCPHHLQQSVHLGWAACTSARQTAGRLPPCVWRLRLRCPAALLRQWPPVCHRRAGRGAAQGLCRKGCVVGVQDCYLAYFLTELAGATFMVFTRTCEHTRRLALQVPPDTP